MIQASDMILFSQLFLFPAVSVCDKHLIPNADFLKTRKTRKILELQQFSKHYPMKRMYSPEIV